MHDARANRASADVPFFRSLLWIIVFVVLAAAVSTIFSLILTDFVYGNPYRTTRNTLSTMALFSALIGPIATLGILIVFSATQLIQSYAMRTLYPRHGTSAYRFIALMVPVMSIVTWYCYDYLTPSNFDLAINTGPDWVPYRHGLTLDRYGAALACQSAVTAFNLLYFHVATIRRSRNILIASVIVVAVVAGLVIGHRQAVTQNHFVDSAPQAN
ncbi:MAG: hypothetical protein V4801_05555 [Burkholderia gladioli]